MNILILGENGIARKNWGHQLFLNSFSKFHNVVYWGSKYSHFNPKLSIAQVIEKYGRPDIILTYMAKRCYPFTSLADIKNIPKVHIEVDFFRRERKGYKGQYDLSGYNRYKDFFASNKFSLIFGVSTPTINGLVEAKITNEAIYLPFCVDIDVYKNLNMNRVVDVMAVFSSGTHAYPRRQRVQKTLNYAGRKRNFKAMTRPVFHQQYVSYLNQCKIFVTSNNKWGTISMKYYEVMACGTLLLADPPVDLGKVGLRDKVHLVLYNSMDDLVDKVSYYLNHPDERQTIANNGMEITRNIHSTTYRIKQLTDIVNEKIFGGKK